MKNFLGVVFLFFGVHAAAQKKKFVLSGDFGNDYKGTIVLKLDDKELNADIEHGKFIIEGKLEAPTIATIQVENSNCATEILIDSGTLSAAMKMQLMKIASIPCITSIDIKGGGSVYDAYYMLTKGMNDLRKTIRNMDEYNLKVAGLYKEYLKQYPGFLFLSQSLYTRSSMFSAAMLSEIFSEFPAAQKKSRYYEALQSVINQKNITIPGTLLTDFQQRKTDGKKFSLSSLKGQTVLIDFWASWCRPCRMENPNVVKMYERYHKKGLEIVGVSLDENFDAWKTAIEADHLNWIHVSDLNGWRNAVAEKFYVKSIPFNILIDAEGKILATNLTGSALEAKLRTLFGE